MFEDKVNPNALIIKLKEPGDIPVNVRHPLFTKQGTKEWHSLRQKTFLTGSTLYSGLGLRTLSEQKTLLKKKSEDMVKSQRPMKDTSPGQIEDTSPGQMEDTSPMPMKSASLGYMEDKLLVHVKDTSQDEKTSEKKSINKFMQWGLDHEKDAVATIVSYVLPLYYPHLMYVECGASFIADEFGSNLIEVSADGLLCRVNTISKTVDEVITKVEVKCPFPPSPESYKLPVYYELPKYYALHVLAEMEAEPSTSECLFACYSEQSTVVMIIHFESEIWSIVREEAKQLVTQLKQGKFPRHKTEINRDVLPAKIRDFVDRNVQVLVEVPSVKSINDDTKSCDDTCQKADDKNPFVFPSIVNCKYTGVPRVKELSTCFMNIKEMFSEAYNLCRSKAQELFVCHVSDVDLSGNIEEPMSLPICYGFKPKSFCADEKRMTYDTVMNALVVNKQVDIICTCFDGEFFSLITTDKNNNPLTVFGLQKRLWGRVAKLSKANIIQLIIEMSRVNEADVPLHEYVRRGNSSHSVIVEGVKMPHGSKEDYLKAKKEADKRKAGNAKKRAQVEVISRQVTHQQTKNQSHQGRGSFINQSLCLPQLSLISMTNHTPN